MSKGLLAHNGFLIRKGFKAEENGFLAHKGLLNIVSGVPFKSDITRRHYTRSDYNLPDLVGSNDGQVLGLVSKFDGAGSVDLGRPDIINFIPQVDAFEISGWFNSMNSGTLYSFGAGPVAKDKQLQISTTPAIVIGGITTQSNIIYADGLNHFIKLRVPASTEGLKCWVDGVEVISNGLIGSVVNSSRNAYFGARTNGTGFRLTGDLWDWNFYKGNGDTKELVLSVPFPHLGIGFDENNNPIELEVSETGVTPAYAVGGSLHLQNYGGVSRNPELFTGFTGLGAGWIDNGDGSYTCDGTQSVTSYLQLSGVLDVGISYIASSALTSNNGGGCGMKLGGLSTLVDFDDLNELIIVQTATSSTITIAAAVGFVGTVGSYISLTLSSPGIIPNGHDGQPLYTLGDGDTFFAGSSSRLNLLHSKLRLYTLGDTDQAQMMWDMSNITYWKPSVQDLLTYDSGDTGLHDISHMNQDFINLYVQDDYKYAMWIKIKNNQIADLFTYPTNLEGDNITKAEKYIS